MLSSNSLCTLLGGFYFAASSMFRRFHSCEHTITVAANVLDLTISLGVHGLHRNILVGVNVLDRTISVCVHGFHRTITVATPVCG